MMGAIIIVGIIGGVVSYFAIVVYRYLKDALL
jgi:hypothetical protein